MFSPKFRNPAYDAAVLAALLGRFRVVIGCGIVMYMLFSILDHLVYPEVAGQFLIVRSIFSVFLLASIWLSDKIGKHLFWLVDVVLISAGASISYMIYLSDGANSGYYQGLNIVLMALFTINSYRVGHVLIAGGGILLTYLVAVFASAVPVTADALATALFFIVSTFFFVALSAYLYGTQHEAGFATTARLRETEALKDRFFANISHELRTPLTLVLGPVAKLLDGGSLPDEAVRDLRVVQRNASLLLRHVNDLLDLSKLDEGEMTLAYAQVDAAQLVRFVTSHFETLAVERGITLDVEAKGVASAELDDAKVRRVLFNLVGNALKFTPPGGHVTVRLETTDDKLGVVVADDGPGIPISLRDRVFDRFRQAEQTDARRHGGTGLGLSIAREFVRLHGGELTLEAAAPHGAIFSVSLPRFAPKGAAFVAPLEDSLPDVSTATAKSSKSVPVRGAATVLVVEDHPDMNAFVCDALGSTWRVVSARDGNEGLDMARLHRPDLIVTDVMMPGMSGVEMLETLRLDASFANMPVLVLTAKADESLKESLLVSGAQDYLAKPFSATELLARVGNLIALKRVRDVLEGELSRSGDSLASMAQELADAGRAKDEFLMNLSHELRTPLTAILGWTEMLSDGSLDETDTDSALTTIDRNARLQLRLVDDLLDVSRIVQGRLTLTLEPGDLAQFAAAAVSSISAAAAAKNIEVTLTASTPVHVRCDGDRMQQVIWNLLCNAVKFTPSGGHIRVTVERSEELARLVVSDDGDGIAPEFLPHVFERLRQGDSSTTKRHGGLGLGLAIAHHLVARHGGQITAESAGKGRGAVFVVTLPLAQAEVTSGLGAEAGRESRSGAAGPSSGPRPGELRSRPASHADA